MSKILVYIMDKIVWMLLVTALTTQALQMAGIMESPKGLQEITYTQGNEYNYQLSVGSSDSRGKRQAEERSQLIDNIFNVPIQTLNAVNNLIQNSRPAFRSIRDFAIRRFAKRAHSIPTSTESSDTGTRKRSYPVYIKSKEEDEHKA